MIRVLALCLASAVVLLVFGLWPELDLAASGYFFDGTGFPLASDPYNVALRWVLRVTPYLPFLAGLIILAGTRRLPDPILGLGRRGWAVIVLTFVLGPGLLVNLGLKANWGRARPRQVAEFGGDFLFTPAYQWADQCARNCSFVSGEVSGVTALSMALAALLMANRAHLGPRGFWVLASGVGALPFLSAFQRISAGAHFLSDAILAALFTLIVGLLVQGLVAPKAR